MTRHDPNSNKILLLLLKSDSTYLCKNHALVTRLSFSRHAVNTCGLRVTTTTLFCTVLRVTSAGRSISSLESSCRVHDMPNSEVAGDATVALRRRVK